MIFVEGPDGRIGGALLPVGSQQPGPIGVSRANGQIRLEIPGKSVKIVGVGPLTMGIRCTKPVIVRRREGEQDGRA